MPASRSYVARASRGPCRCRRPRSTVTPAARSAHRRSAVALLGPVASALFISLPVGFVFALLLGSADAVFADLLRSPFEHVPFPRSARALLVVAAAGGAFLTLAVRVAGPAPRWRWPRTHRGRRAAARRLDRAPRDGGCCLRPLRRRAGVRVLRRTTLRPRADGSLLRRVRAIRLLADARGGDLDRRS